MHLSHSLVLTIPSQLLFKLTENTRLLLFSHLDFLSFSLFLSFPSSLLSPFLTLFLPSFHSCSQSLSLKRVTLFKTSFSFFFLQPETWGLIIWLFLITSIAKFLILLSVSELTQYNSYLGSLLWLVLHHRYRSGLDWKFNETNSHPCVPSK